MKAAVYILFLAVFLAITFFGLGPVLLADGTTTERLITLAVVIVLYLILIVLFILFMKKKK